MALSLPLAFSIYEGVLLLAMAILPSSALTQTGDSPARLSVADWANGPEHLPCRR